MNPYQPLFEAAVESGNAEHDSQFYRRAHEFANYLSTIHSIPLRRVCDVLAVLSPMKSWPENLRLARSACLYVQECDLSSVGDVAMALLDLPVMSSRRLATCKALLGGGVSGPKVECFAANIKGDLTQVTIDRHMLTAAGFNADTSTKHARQTCTSHVLNVNQSRVYSVNTYYPAEVQAIVWAEVRRQKGYK
jgi:hypothetical protein